MAKSGLKHIDVGAELARTEWESEESHELIHGISFPALPVERQLFYRDDEHKWYIYSGTEWVWLGGGGGLAVHGNEYHDPDFATEAALASHAAAATDIHGVGANYIPAAPAASHLVRTFTKGWTSGKSLIGSGVGADPTEMDFPPAFSRVHACPSDENANRQTFAPGAWLRVLLASEEEDTLGEFDSSVKAGTATGTSTNHLVDTTLNQFVPGDVGRTVWNTTDNTYATITAYNSTSDVTISADIMASGEGYKLYFSLFTATYAGYYLAVGIIRCSTEADKSYFVGIFKNGTDYLTAGLQSSITANWMMTASVLGYVKLNANDTLDLRFYHNSTTAKEIVATKGQTAFQVFRLV